MRLRRKGEREGGTKVVHPFASFVSIPFGDRMEMTLFLKCHSNAKKLKNPLISSPTDSPFILVHPFASLEK